MEALGFFAMLLVGASLGMLGGGGSILAVPVLVYAFGVPATEATGYSLLIVGATSLAGAVGYWKQGLIVPKIALIFAIPSFISVFLTRAFLIPALPSHFSLGEFSIERGRLLMILFALLMVVTAIAMIRRRNQVSTVTVMQAEACECRPLILDGVAVGLLAGLFGAGGGFLIIPALVLLAHLPMRLAVGTSLAIIAIQSLIGFAGTMEASFETGAAMHWTFLLEITALAIIGMLAGVWLARRVQTEQLRAAFGWLVLLVGFGIGIRELLS